MLPNISYNWIKIGFKSLFFLGLPFMLYLSITPTNADIKAFSIIEKQGLAPIYYTHDNPINPFGLHFRFYGGASLPESNKISENEIPLLLEKYKKSEQCFYLYTKFRCSDKQPDVLKKEFKRIYVKYNPFIIRLNIFNWTSRASNPTLYYYDND